MRIDRRCWARAIHLEKVWWGFRGIAKPRSVKDLNQRGGGLAAEQLVLSDEGHMDVLHHQEAKYVAENDDHHADWEEYVRRRHHNHFQCPHGLPEERQAYQEAVDVMLKDEAARYDWASDYVDWQWVRDQVHSYFESEEATFYFLAQHPVDSVWSRYDEKWLPLDEVLGYCGSCDEPLTEDRILPDVNRGQPHRFDPECEADACRAMQFCLFDHEEKPRRIFQCDLCSWTDTTDDFDGEESFISKHGRPFNWPPGAPYPPRCSFTGYPMDVPPHED